MPSHSTNRRRFIHQLGLTTGGLMLFPFGCKEAVPPDVRITNVSFFTLPKARRKIPGKGAFQEELPARGRENFMRIDTDKGLSGIGYFTGSTRVARTLIGKNLSEIFQEGRMQHAPGLTAALWDVLGKVHNAPIWKMMGDSQRETVPVMDSSFYFMDLAEGNEQGYGQKFYQEIQHSKELGHEVFQFQVGRGAKWMSPEEGLERDMELLAGFSEYFREGGQLGIQGGESFTSNTALQLLSAGGAHQYAFIDSLIPAEPETCLMLRKAAEKMGINSLWSGGMQFDKADQMQIYLRSGAFDIIRPSLMRASISNIKDIAMASTGGVPGRSSRSRGPPRRR
ncbi:MAG: hypothetical protein AAF206_32160, partial [Bacteroidota bacterium]